MSAVDCCLTNFPIGVVEIAWTMNMTSNTNPPQPRYMKYRSALLNSHDQSSVNGEIRSSGAGGSSKNNWDKFLVPTHITDAESSSAEQPKYMKYRSSLKGSAVKEVRVSAASPSDPPSSVNHDDDERPAFVVSRRREPTGENRSIHDLIPAPAVPEEQPEQQRTYETVVSSRFSYPERRPSRIPRYHEYRSGLAQRTSPANSVSGGSTTKFSNVMDHDYVVGNRTSNGVKVPDAIDYHQEENKISSKYKSNSHKKIEDSETADSTSSSVLLQQHLQQQQKHQQRPLQQRQLQQRPSQQRSQQPESLMHLQRHVSEPRLPQHHQLQLEDDGDIEVCTTSTILSNESGSDGLASYLSGQSRYSKYRRSLSYEIRKSRSGHDPPGKTAEDPPGKKATDVMLMRSTYARKAYAGYYHILEKDESVTNVSNSDKTGGEVDDTTTSSLPVPGDSESQVIREDQMYIGGSQGMQLRNRKAPDAESGISALKTNDDDDAHHHLVSPVHAVVHNETTNGDIRIDREVVSPYLSSRDENGHATRKHSPSRVSDKFIPIMLSSDIDPKDILVVNPVSTQKEATTKLHNISTTPVNESGGSVQSQSVDGKAKLVSFDAIGSVHGSVVSSDTASTDYRPSNYFSDSMCGLKDVLADVIGLSRLSESERRRTEELFMFWDQIEQDRKNVESTIGKNKKSNRRAMRASKATKAPKQEATRAPKQEASKPPKQEATKPPKEEKDVEQNKKKKALTPPYVKKPYIQNSTESSTLELMEEANQNQEKRRSTKGPQTLSPDIEQGAPRVTRNPVVGGNGCSITFDELGVSETADSRRRQSKLLFRKRLRTAGMIALFVVIPVSIGIYFIWKKL